MISYPVTFQTTAPIVDLLALIHFLTQIFWRESELKVIIYDYIKKVVVAQGFEFCLNPSSTLAALPFFHYLAVFKQLLLLRRYFFL